MRAVASLDREGNYMKRISIAILVLAVTAIAISGIVAGTVGNAGTVDSKKDIGYDSEETCGREYYDGPHCDADTAGGGGWFVVDGFKNTFGFFLNKSDLANSSFVFQVRSSMMTVHSLNFTNIVFEDDDGDGNWTAHAYGNATVKSLDVFSFHLQVSDCGKGDVDRIDLWLDSDDASYHWGANGLGGGNIWIYVSD